ncbi:MAG TPA: AAA family ATPase [Solirubrobacterales bacterium]|nr:AAA family ATPase [Solirubrobacterales bacterium]
MTELSEPMPSVAALAIEGAKGVGKTATAARRAALIRELDDPTQRSIAVADPSRLLDGPLPVLIDEWQYVPESWDLVRRAVDGGAAPGSFLLTGSSRPAERGSHSGAARIVSLRMRPLALSERGIASPTVSLSNLLRGGRPRLTGACATGLEDYDEEIVSSGFPGLRSLSGRALRAQLDGYLTRIVDRDFEELGHNLRDPAALRRWMTAYAAAARLLGVDADALLEGRDAGPSVPRDGTLLGALFESLVTLSVRTYAQAAEAIVTTGTEAYRRKDGIAVIPAALLGP